jgi:hypothetical protein
MYGEILTMLENVGKSKMAKTFKIGYPLWSPPDYKFAGTLLR